MLSEVQFDLKNCTWTQTDLSYTIALRSGTCLFERAMVKTCPASTVNAKQKLFTTRSDTISKSLPHTASSTSSATLPENKIAVGILNRQEFHGRADTCFQLNDTNWSDVLTKPLVQQWGRAAEQHRTAVNKAACRRLATGENTVSEGWIIALFRREIEAGQSNVCKVSCYKQIQNNTVSTSGYVDPMPWGLRKIRAYS